MFEGQIYSPFFVLKRSAPRNRHYLQPPTQIARTINIKLTPYNHDLQPSGLSRSGHPRTLCCELEYVRDGEKFASPRENCDCLHTRVSGQHAYSPREISLSRYR
jgi:hypothetical protein